MAESASDKTRRDRGTGSIWPSKRDGIYWVKFYDHGESHRESTGLRGREGRAAAVKLLAKRIGEISAGKFAPDAHRLRIADLRRLVVDDYELKGRVSAKRDKKGRTKVDGSFDHIEDYFGARPVPLIAPRMAEYLAARKRAGAKPGTMRREVAAFRRGCTLAAKRGLLPGRPMIETVEPAPPRKGFVSEDVLTKILKALPDDLRPFVEFAYLSGWRRGKIIELQWRDVDRDRGVITAPAAASENKRAPGLLPFRADPRLERLVEDQWARAQRWRMERGELCPHVFWTGTKRGARPVGDFRDAWQKAVKAAGRPDTRFHDFRRTRATLWDGAGLSLKQAMTLGGWSAPKTYLGYVQEDEAALESAVGRAAAYELAATQGRAQRRSKRATDGSGQ